MFYLYVLYLYLVSPSNDSTHSREWNTILIIVLLLSFGIIIAICCICVCCLFLTANKCKEENNKQTVQPTGLTHNKFGGSNTETIYPPRTPTLSLPPEINSPFQPTV